MNQESKTTSPQVMGTRLRNGQGGCPPAWISSTRSRAGERGRILAVLVVALVALAALYLFLNNNSETPRPILRIGTAQITVEIADEFSEQVRGLSRRESLCQDCGMLFVYESPRILSVWMKDMKFPLDIIFIRDGKITEIYENVPIPEPGKAIPTIWSKYEAEMFLEVNAGFTKQRSLKPGAEVEPHGQRPW